MYEIPTMLGNWKRYTALILNNKNIYAYVIPKTLGGIHILLRTTKKYCEQHIRLY